MKALIVVDVQNDFLPGGALAVPDGELVIPVINKVADDFGLVVATQDWHPADHLSFASQHPGRRPGETILLHGRPQVLWPDHCVQGTKGAEFSAGLDGAATENVFRKGTDRSIDSYSGFLDNDHRTHTGLHSFLQSREVSHVCVCGLATDYCVKFTALDAVELGYQTSLLVDACRGVNLQPNDVVTAKRTIQAAGVMLV